MIAVAGLLLAGAIASPPALALQSSAIGAPTAHAADLTCPSENMLFGVVGYVTDHLTGVAAMCTEIEGNAATQDQSAGVFSGGTNAAANCPPTVYMYGLAATINKSNGQILGLLPLCGKQAHDGYAAIGNMQTGGNPDIVRTKVVCGPGYSGIGLTVWTADAAHNVITGIALKCETVPTMLAGTAASSSDFAGDWTLAIGGKPTAMHLSADASGLVSGTYDDGGVNGRISNGSVNGRIMQFNWSEAGGEHGGGGFELDAAGQSLSGNRFASDGSSIFWTATRGAPASAGAGSSSSSGGAGSAGGASSGGAAPSGPGGTSGGAAPGASGGTMATLSGDGLPDVSVDISSVATTPATTKSAANVRGTASTKGAIVASLPANTPLDCLQLDPGAYGAYLGGGKWCAVQGQADSGGSIIAWISNSVLNLAGSATGSSSGGGTAASGSSSGGSSSGGGSASSDASAFLGIWTVSLAGTPPFLMEFHQSGAKIGGSYLLPNGPGSIRGGTVNGGTLHFRWAQNGFTGDGTFTVSGSGLTGTFQFDNGGPGGNWTAHR